MLNIAILISIVGLTVALLLTAYRVLRGPTVADRIVGLDAASVLIIALVVVSSMWLREKEYLAYVLVLAVLSFVGTVALAKYIERGVVIERDPD